MPTWRGWFEARRAPRNDNPKKTDIMKKYLIILRNWRIAILAILAIMAFVLLVSDAQSVTLFFISKAAAFAIAALTCALGAYWDERGLIDEIHQLTTEE